MDVDGVIALDGLDGLLKSAPADETPGSDDVRDDLDVDVHVP
jgi:hypothetical protein